MLSGEVLQSLRAAPTLETYQPTSQHIRSLLDDTLSARDCSASLNCDLGAVLFSISLVYFPL